MGVPIEAGERKALGIGFLKAMERANADSLSDEGHALRAWWTNWPDPLQLSITQEEPDMSIAVTEDPRRFGYFSVHNAVKAELACDEGTCRAYEDIFTFARWRAQGFCVRKGEKGTRISTFIPIKRIDKEGDEKVVAKRRKTAVVFCRHQVELIG
jgi:hypothetical protein